MITFPGVGIVLIGLLLQPIAQAYTEEANKKLSLTINGAPEREGCDRKSL
jgi:hypothetical protein